MTEKTAPQQLLDLSLPDNDSGARTVREYLTALLEAAWRSGDGIRPFGNSGWQHDLYEPMTRAGLARVGYDEDGYATDGEGSASYAEADTLIIAAIRSLDGAVPGSTTTTAYLVRDRSGHIVIVAARDSDGYLVLKRASAELPVAVFAPGGWDVIIKEPPGDVHARSPWVKPAAGHDHG